MNSCVCSKCGNNLVIEYIGNYGTIYSIRKDGTIGRRIKTVKYGESNDRYMVYCPSCGTGYDGRFLNGKYIPYKEEK